MRFNLYCDIKAISFSSIFDPSARVMHIVFTLLDQIIYLSAVVKSQAFRNIFPIKRFWLLVKCHYVQEFKYHVNLVFDIIFDSVVINALSEWNNLRSKSSFLVLVAIIFVLCCYWLWDLGLSKLSQSCLALLMLFFLSNL